MRAVITSGGLADSDEIIHNKVPAYYRRLPAASAQAATNWNP
jgi:hypothetical protein